MKTILVPTDFSKHANNAMKYAIQLAEQLQVKPVFFHSACMPFSRQLLEVQASKRKEMDNAYEEEKILQLETTLDKLYEKLHLNRDFHGTEVMVKSGLLVVEDILAASRKVKADMIVTGTHGCTGAEKLFGSNTSTLIYKSDIPVMAIPKNYRYRPIRKILYASDLRKAQKELSEILHIAEAFDARIDVLNLYYSKQVDDQEIFKDILRKTDYDNLRLLRLERHPDETLLSQLRQFVEHHTLNLLVMFPQDRNFFDKIFNGSKTERMSYNLKAPLLSIKGD